MSSFFYSPSFENSPDVDRLGLNVYLDGQFTGSYGQCVEFVRRHLIHTNGITFPSVRHANELFQRATEPSFFRRIGGGGIHALRPRIPRVGDLVFLHHSVTGHVGIVTGFNRATDDITIADQNFEYGPYWANPSYAYRMPRTSPEIVGYVRLS